MGRDVYNGLGHNHEYSTVGLRDLREHRTLHPHAEHRTLDNRLAVQPLLPITSRFNYTVYN